MQKIQSVSRPGLWKLLLIWASIGLQSFGGGASTTFLIQREFVDKRHWVTMEEIVHFWNLCVMVPGVNLIALTILIGHKLRGRTGVVVSLAGMLIPSAAITCLIAAIFKEIEQLRAVQDVVKGIIPATAGIMLLVGLRFMQPQIKFARQKGLLSLLISVALIVLSFVSIAVLQVPVIVVLPCAGMLGVLCFTRTSQVTSTLKEND